MALCVISMVEVAEKGRHREKSLTGKCDVDFSQASSMPEPFLRLLWPSSIWSTPGQSAWTGCAFLSSGRGQMVRKIQCELKEGIQRRYGQGWRRLAGGDDVCQSYSVLGG